MYTTRISQWPPVYRRSITFIFIPSINRKFFVKLLHVGVTVSFGKDAGSGDRCKAAIAFHKTLMGYTGEWFESVSIDQQQPGFCDRPSIARCMAR